VAAGRGRQARTRGEGAETARDPPRGAQGVPVRTDPRLRRGPRLPGVR
jgi:hypothetical protein